MRRPLLFLLSLAALGLTACSRCGKAATPAGPPALELARRLPRSAEAVVLVPDLGVLGEKAALVQRLKVASFLAQLQGFGSAEEYLSAVMGQVGVDLRSREALRQAGVDPERGLAVALLAQGRAYSVVGTREPRKLQETLARLARDRLGAGVVSRQPREELTLVTFSRTQDGRPELGLLVKDGYAFIAAGSSVAELPAWASLQPSAALAEDRAYVASLGRLPAERDLWVHLPAASTRAARYMLLGSSLSGRLTREELTLVADVPWPDTRRSLEVLQPLAGPDLAGLLPDDAFLVARFAGDPPRLEPFLALLLGSGMERAARESGFDVKGALSNLRPGQVLSLSLAPTARLGGTLAALDLRQVDPVGLLHLTAAAEVKESLQAARALERIPPFAARLGARMVPADRGGQKVYLTSYRRGEGAHLALKGNALLMATPEQRLLDALARVGKTPPGTRRPGPLSDPALLERLDGRAAVVVVDLARLAESVRALPSEAWGMGGFAIKALALRWLEAIDDLRAITLGLSAREGAVQAELSLSLRAAGE